MIGHSLGSILRDDYHSRDEIRLMIKFDRLHSHGENIRLERALEELLGHNTVKVVDPEEEPEDRRNQMLNEYRRRRSCFAQAACLDSEIAWVYSCKECIHRLHVYENGRERVPLQ